MSTRALLNTLMWHKAAKALPHLAFLDTALVFPWDGLWHAGSVIRC